MKNFQIFAKVSVDVILHHIPFGLGVNLRRVLCFAAEDPPAVVDKIIHIILVWVQLAGAFKAIQSFHFPIQKV